MFVVTWSAPTHRRMQDEKQRALMRPPGPEKDFHILQRI